MSDREELRILVPQSMARAIHRRHFLLGSAALAIGGPTLLAACGGDDKETLTFYNFAEYDDPDLIEDFGKQADIKISNIDTYPSNEEMVAKLEAGGGGTTGYDLVCPTDVYVGQMIQKGLLEELDHTKIPNIKNVQAGLLDRSFDPGNKYSVCKDWGSTGYMWDREIVDRDLETWEDFVDAAQNEASGLTAVLDSSQYLPGVYFWINDIPWTTEKKEDLDAAEKFVLDEIAPHLTAFDSYPNQGVVDGTYALAMIWNGDARRGMIDSGHADQYGYSRGFPRSDLWMDNWCIVKGSEQAEAAHKWINYVLDPKNSLRDLEYHGYNTGVNGVKEAAQDKGLELLDIVFLTDEDLKTLDPDEINDAEQRAIDILAKAKEAAAG